MSSVANYPYIKMDEVGRILSSTKCSPKIFLLQYMIRDRRILLQNYAAHLYGRRTQWYFAVSFAKWRHLSLDLQSNTIIKQLRGHLSTTWTLIVLLYVCGRRISKAPGTSWCATRSASTRRWPKSSQRWSTSTSWALTFRQTPGPLLCSRTNMYWGCPRWSRCWNDSTTCSINSTSHRSASLFLYSCLLWNRLPQDLVNMSFRKFRNSLKLISIYEPL